MLRAVEAVSEDRRQWLGILSRVSRERLRDWGDDWVRAHGELPVFDWLRPPEAGLVMVRGRVGGTGARFNLGEVTVTRCALRVVADGNAAIRVGLGYRQGRAPEVIHLAALADALLQDERTSAVVRVGLVDPARRELADADISLRRRAAATRVEFFTVARESGA